MSGPPARSGGLAQLGERQLCKLDVTGSIPVSSTLRETINDFVPASAGILYLGKLPRWSDF